MHALISLSGKEIIYYVLNKKCALIKERFIALPISTCPLVLPPYLKLCLELHAGSGYNRWLWSHGVFSSDGEIKLEVANCKIVC